MKVFPRLRRLIQFRYWTDTRAKKKRKGELKQAELFDISKETRY